MRQPNRTLCFRFNCSLRHISAHFNIQGAFYRSCYSFERITAKKNPFAWITTYLMKLRLTLFKDNVYILISVPFSLESLIGICCSKCRLLIKFTVLINVISVWIEKAEKENEKKKFLHSFLLAKKLYFRNRTNFIQSHHMSSNQTMISNDHVHTIISFRVN